MGNTLLLAHVCNLGVKRSLPPLSVAVILHFVCCLICPFWMHLHVSHTSHTRAETHLPVGAVVDNSRLSAPEASAGTMVFMLKQQRRRFTVPPFPPSLSPPVRRADSGRASLFHVFNLLSPWAVEIPTLTPDQHLRLIPLSWAAVGSR